jgi:hypothetical protein
MTRIKLSGNWKELATSYMKNYLSTSGISGQNHLLGGHWEVHKIKCIFV